MCRDRRRHPIRLDGEVAENHLGAVVPGSPERLTGLRPNLEPVTVGGVAVCEGWGNERLAFVTVNASYQADTTIGHASLLLAFRKTSSLWRLLVATRDPVSNRQFVTLLPAFSTMLRHDHVSARQLWTTGGEWAWRVWSITRSGEIAFSEVRTFVH